MSLSVVRLVSILLGLIDNIFRFGIGLTKSRTALVAENLFLRKQLALGLKLGIRVTYKDLASLTLRDGTDNEVREPSHAFRREGDAATHLWSFALEFLLRTARVSGHEP